MQERTRIPLKDVIEQMRQDIQISRDAPASIGGDYLPFHITFAYADRLKARQTVKALIAKFQESNLYSQQMQARVKRQSTSDPIDRMEARIAALEKRLGMPPAPAELVDQFAVLPGFNLDVLDPPSLPLQAEYPDRLRFMSIGFGAGLAAALVIAIFRRRPPPIPFPAQSA